ncbi:MAG: hypothetical protein ACYCWW_19775, partial [Deltaproteobacteria bacterium]
AGAGEMAEPWEAFERLWAGRGGSSDPAGAGAELDYRLAVLAVALDRVFPWTRPLLAGTRAGLLDFSGSSEWRLAFAAGRPLDGAFAAWARRRLRERPDAGTERALSFEHWARALGAGESPREATFPVDLSELAFGVRALRRHLGARAAATGGFDQSALAQLCQLAARAPERPWRVRVQWQNGILSAEGAEPRDG